MQLKMEVGHERVIQDSGQRAVILADKSPGSATWQRMIVHSMFALFIICLLAPLFIFIAILIKCDSKGGVIFRQVRTGLKGKHFYIYKFRTMHVNNDGGDVIQATRDDPRVTRFGRFLRKSSLDELPQIINIVKGDMAFVGPRPHALSHDAYYERHVAGYNERFSVHPGLTGWAQVHGERGPTPTLECMERRLRYDLWYASNRSVFLDAHIILKTVPLILSRKNAF